MIFRRRRRISYPNILNVRTLCGPSHPCECCQAPAVYSIQFETSEHSPVIEVYCCTWHEILARRRQWATLFADQDKKIASLQPVEGA
jgi:hypothetical protein